MAREVLAIGNTGEELVSKFNGNFIQTFTDNNAYFYNVESYGAVHDGVTDDTEAIQAAINACVAGGGGTVFFPVGIYIIAGALQNGIEFLDPYTEETKTVDYNSQLYIPASYTILRKPAIRLLGESGSWRNTYPIGTILRSTIAGTGTFPSVICSRCWLHTYGYVNYTDVLMENISVQVNPFIGTTGPSVSGINFLYASHAIVKNCSVGLTPTSLTDWSTERATWTKPSSHVFGIGVGIISDDFGELQGTNSVWGMYYGFLLGEGINADCLMSYNCYIGLVKLKSTYGSLVQYYIANWCTNLIAAQPESIYLGAGKSVLHIMFGIFELWSTTANGPSWNDLENYIIDSNDYLFGCLNGYTLGHSVSPYISKTNGGTNFLVKNAYEGSTYHWTTTTRPASPGRGLTGYNETTDKIEAYTTASGWVDLH